jgi:ABC-type branched-subunit amino acid transport system substrate-binding protein
MGGRRVLVWGRVRVGLVLLAVVAVAASACSSSSHSSGTSAATSAAGSSGSGSSGSGSSGSGSSGSGSSGSGSSGGSSAPGVSSKTVTVGLITSLTGPVAAGFTTVEPGFMARVDLQNAEGGVDGRQIVVDVADDQGSPSGALSAAQTLVSVKHVFAIGTMSIAAPVGDETYLLQNNVPVVGIAVDGPEWEAPNNNMFPAAGSPSSKYPAPVWLGTYYKDAGCTDVGEIGYNTSSGIANEKNTEASVQAAGLKNGYFNDSIPITQEGGFQADIQSLKSSGVDCIDAVTEPSAYLPFIEEAAQAGLHLKTALVSLSPPASELANPQASSAMQDVSTFSPMEWPEMNTAATQAFTAAIQKYDHQTAAPDENEEYAWLSASAVIAGLQAAGANPTRASFTSGLRAVTDFNADGLLVTPMNFTADFGTGAEGTGPQAPAAGQPASQGSCVYIETYQGSAWHAQSTPICGGLVPNSNAG